VVKSLAFNMVGSTHERKANRQIQSK